MTSNFFNNNDVKKSLNSKQDIHSVDSNKNKLTFEKAFSFRKSNANTGSIIANPSNSNLNNLLTQSHITGNISNNATPLVINNFPPQSQISISINNFNISNYNMNSKKFKKSNNLISNSLNMTPNNLIEVTKSMDSHKISANLIPGIIQSNNNNSSNATLTPNRAASKNKSFVYINDESSPMKQNQIVDKIDKIQCNLQSSKNNTNVFNSGTKLKIVKSEFYPNKEGKLKPCLTKKPNKIETIIDGNNDDSFINELADLLNNVDTKKQPIIHAPQVNELKQEFIPDEDNKIIHVNEVINFNLRRSLTQELTLHNYNR